MTTAQRLTYSLTNNASQIVEFVVVLNPTGVAERIEDVVGKRPVGMRGIESVLQQLLNAGRGNDFVYCLSVPVDLSGYSAEEQAAIYQAVGIGTTADTLGQALGVNALRLWEQANAAEDAAAATDAPPETAAPPITVPTEPRWPRRKVLRVVLGALLLVLAIVGAGYTLRLIRKR